MTASTATRLFFIALGCLAWALPCVKAGESFRGETLTEGVFLLRPADTASARTNSLVIALDDGLVVIEAQPTPALARELIAAVNELSPKPIRYLVLSNSHAEVAGGASAFPESTVVIAAEEFPLALDDEGYDFGAEARAAAPDPAQWRRPEIRRPDLLVTETLLLDDSRHRIEIVNRRQGHSPGSLLVRLPSADLLYMGPLLFPDRNPYSRDADTRRWLSSLNNVSTYPIERLVPLHGPVVDVLELRRNRNALIWIEARVRAGFVDRLEPEQIHRRVLDDPELAEQFDTDASPSFLPDLVDRFIEKIQNDRRRRGR